MLNLWLGQQIYGCVAMEVTGMQKGDWPDLKEAGVTALSVFVRVCLVL